MYFASKRYLSVKKIVGWSSGKGGPTSTIVGLPDKYNSWIARDVPSTAQTTPTTLNNDVGAQFVVLRDVDESCEYQGVSWQQSPSVPKPVAETHSIYGSRMDGGYGEFILTHHSRGGGRRRRGRIPSSVVCTMARTGV